MNDQTISEAIDDGASSADDVFAALNITTKCGTCKSSVEGMVQAVIDERDGVKTVDPALVSSRDFKMAAE